LLRAQVRHKARILRVCFWWRETGFVHFMWLYSPSQPVAPTLMVTLFYMIMTLLLIFSRARPLLRKHNFKPLQLLVLSSISSLMSQRALLKRSINFIIDLQTSVSEYSTIIENHKTLAGSLSCTLLIILVITRWGQRGNVELLRHLWEGDETEMVRFHYPWLFVFVWQQLLEGGS
jgi:hypothetical protein